MNNLIILLAQTKSEATFDILLLLLVAAIIGFITALYYSKFLFLKKLLVLESDMDKMNDQLVRKIIKISVLNKNLFEKDNELISQIKNYNSIVELYQEVVKEKEETNFKEGRKGRILYEKDELFVNGINNQHLHGYNNFGPSVEPENSKTINNGVTGLWKTGQKIREFDKVSPRKEQTLNETERHEALINIAQCKSLLNYESFGIALEAEKDDLKMISGIGTSIEERLNALDIFTFRQISNFTPQDIDMINKAIEYFTGRIEGDEWVKQAIEIVHNQDKWSDLLDKVSEKKVNIYYNRIGFAKKEDADNLTTISGIGGWIKDKLNALDIYTFRQISNFTNEDIIMVTEALELFPGRIERDEWIIQAQELVRIAGKKAELYKRIIERKDKVYYDRLGMAYKHQANNLTLIKGIGLWIEERLNMLDIYTFEQLSKLTPADEELIAEILEISPDRISRDKWVKQAQNLLKTQLHFETV